MITNYPQHQEKLLSNIFHKNKTAEEIRADDQARKATEEAKTATRVRNSSGDARAANRARMATEEPK